MRDDGRHLSSSASDRRLTDRRRRRDQSRLGSQYANAICRGICVLRGEEGSETLTRITDEVVKETRYTDQNVKPGVRYVYAVTAVDNQSPQPNVSAESERVEVTAR